MLIIWPATRICTEPFVSQASHLMLRAMFYLFHEISKDPQLHEIYESGK